MATKTYENTDTVSGVSIKVVVTANETETSWTLTNVKVSIQNTVKRIHLKLQYAKYLYSYGYTPSYSTIVDVTGTPSECGFSNDGSYFSRTITYSTASFDKSKENVTNVNFVYNIGFTTSTTSNAINNNLGAGVYINVPKWTSYPVTFNMNGGSGGPSNQTKYYGEGLTLSTSKPTRSGFDFISWNTNSSGTGTNYASGATYSSNAALTLYAKWLSSAKPPTISSMSVIRCNSSGTADDEGTYCKLTAAWKVDTTSAGLSDNQGVVTGTIKGSGSSSRKITFSSGTSGTSGTARALISDCDVDVQYTVTVTVTNSKIGTGQSAALAMTRSDILTKAKFVIDCISGGDGVGIGVAAGHNRFDVGWNAYFNNNITATGKVKASNLQYSKETVLANIMTMRTNWACQSVYAYKIGNMVQIDMQLRNNVARTAGTSVAVCDLASNYRPICYVNFGCDNGGGHITQSGAVYYTPTRALAADTGINLGLCFLCGTPSWT